MNSKFELWEGVLCSISYDRLTSANSKTSIYNNTRVNWIFRLPNY